MTEDNNVNVNTDSNLPAMSASDAVRDEKGRIIVKCSCEKTLKVPAFRSGKTVSCPSCHQKIAVPAIAKDPSERDEQQYSPHDTFAETVRSEIERIESGEAKNIGKSLITLVVSVILFISLGLFRSSLSGIALLVGVIFVHECGHFIGMKLLKYKDVKMFFIPLFGAAVSGKETVPSGGKKAIVSLLGPALGILIGIGTGLSYLVTKQPILADATRTFLFLNTFNLLPFHPLDGGQLFDALLFSRHPRIEVVFKIITALILGWIAYLFKDVIFGMFALFAFISIRGTHISATIARSIREEMIKANSTFAGDIPSEVMQKIILLLRKKLPSEHRNPKLFASYIIGIW